MLRVVWWGGLTTWGCPPSRLHPTMNGGMTCDRGVDGRTMNYGFKIFMGGCTTYFQDTACKNRPLCQDVFGRPEYVCVSVLCEYVCVVVDMFGRRLREARGQ